MLSHQFQPLVYLKLLIRFLPNLCYNYYVLHIHDLIYQMWKNWLVEHKICIFLNQACPGLWLPCACFLKIVSVQISVCTCVSTPKAINNWRDAQTDAQTDAQQWFIALTQITGRKWFVQNVTDYSDWHMNRVLSSSTQDVSIPLQFSREPCGTTQGRSYDILVSTWSTKMHGMAVVWYKINTFAQSLVHGVI